MKVIYPPPKKITRPKYEVIQAFLDIGYTQGEIGGKLGVCRQTIQRMIANNNPRFRPGKRHPALPHLREYCVKEDRNKEILRMRFEEGCTLQEIADKFKVTRTRIGTIIKNSYKNEEDAIEKKDKVITAKLKRGARLSTREKKRLFE